MEHPEAAVLGPRRLDLDHGLFKECEQSLVRGRYFDLPGLAEQVDSICAAAERLQEC
ncbi:MAG: hypothetical protein ACOYN0_19980 [Phycisphaerales bacterium]